MPSAAAPASPDRGDLDAIMREIREAAARPLPTPTPVATPRPVPTRVATRQVRPTPTTAPTAKPSSKVESPKADPKAKAGAKELAKVDPKAKPTPAKKKPEEPKSPARIWVQVAGGANLGALPREWTALAGKAPDLKGKGPWTAKNRATNRLLAGPFKSETEAQAAVSRLRKIGIGAFQWTSEEGEAVSKLGRK
jgi:hypothetical protein